MATDEFYDDDFFDEPLDPEEYSDPFYQDREYVRDLLGEFGIESYDQILLDFENVDPSGLRGQRFDTFEEAVIWLHDIGVLAFSNVVRMDDDTYAVEIDDDTGGTGTN